MPPDLGSLLGDDDSEVAVMLRGLAFLEAKPPTADEVVRKVQVGALERRIDEMRVRGRSRSGLRGVYRWFPGVDSVGAPSPRTLESGMSVDKIVDELAARGRQRGFLMTAEIEQETERGRRPSRLIRQSPRRPSQAGDRVP